MSGTQRASYRTVARLGASILLGWLAVTRPASAQVMDRMVHGLVLVDQVEHRSVPGRSPVAWDVIGWLGGDFNRLWVRSSGTRSTANGETDVETGLFLGRLIAPFWDLLLGVQVEHRAGDGARRTRTSGVLSLEGLAPYWFELEPSLVVGSGGQVSAELVASYDLFVTQRMVAQPRLDIRGAAREARDFGVGVGLNDTSLGLRLRYEIRREFAPYIGVQLHRSYGGTADMARAAGEPTRGAVLVAGVRAWF
jgi:copper resistance protein B